MSTTPEIEIVQLTPELAQEFLDANTANYRKIRRGDVHKYAAAMRRGEFNTVVPSNDAIAISEDGILTNGQQRCAAVIQSGVTIPVIVLRGGGLDLADVMDTGRKRSVNTVLAHHGYADSVAVAGIVRAYGYVLDGGNSSRDLTNPQILAFVEKNYEDLIRPAVTVGRRCHTQVGLARSVAGGVYMAAAQIDQERAEEFFARVCDGVGLYPSHPAYTLRTRLAQLRTKRARTDAPYATAITIKAWNAFDKRRSLGVLKWRSGQSPSEAFPEIQSPRPLLQV